MSGVHFDFADAFHRLVAATNGACSQEVQQTDVSTPLAQLFALLAAL